MAEAPTYDDGYDDGYDDDDGDEAHVDDIEFGQNVADMVFRKGPCVAEQIICIHCGCPQIMVHAFDESLPCVDCGKRNVSSVPRYPDLHKLDGPL